MLDIVFTLDSVIVDYIALCKTKEHPESYLISVLHKVQNKYGYLTVQHMEEVAHLLEVPTATVYGVATFYHYFKLTPKGKYSISICLGTACFVKGAEDILNSFKSELGIDLGETTKDGLFSLEGTRCLGICALAPVVMVNDEVYSKVAQSQVSEIIKTIKKRNKEALLAV